MGRAWWPRNGAEFGSLAVAVALLAGGGYSLANPEVVAPASAALLPSESAPPGNGEIRSTWLAQRVLGLTPDTPRSVAPLPVVVPPMLAPKPVVVPPRSALVAPTPVDGSSPTVTPITTRTAKPSVGAAQPEAPATTAAQPSTPVDTSQSTTATDGSSRTPTSSPSEPSQPTTTDPTPPSDTATHSPSESPSSSDPEPTGPAPVSQTLPAPPETTRSSSGGTGSGVDTGAGEDAADKGGSSSTATGSDPEPTGPPAVPGD